MFSFTNFKSYHLDPYIQLIKIKTLTSVNLKRIITPIMIEIRVEITLKRYSLAKLYQNSVIQSKSYHLNAILT